MTEQAVPPRRPPLTYERIASAAINFIDESGLASPTMRAVGDALGVEAMPLYRHVAGKDRLLYAVAEQMVEEMRDDGGDGSEPGDGWQEFLHRLAHGVRRVAMAHPQAFVLVTSLPTDGPGIRPPLRTPAWVESFLTRLIADGFSDDAAAEAYRSFTALLLGQLFLEVSGGDVVRPTRFEPATSARSRAAVTSPAFPHLRQMQAGLTTTRAAAEFDENLENLIDQLVTKLAS